MKAVPHVVVQHYPPTQPYVARCTAGDHTGDAAAICDCWVVGPSGKGFSASLCPEHFHRHRNDWLRRGWILVEHMDSSAQQPK